MSSSQNHVGPGGGVGAGAAAGAGRVGKDVIHIDRRAAIGMKCDADLVGRSAAGADGVWGCNHVC